MAVSKYVVIDFQGLRGVRNDFVYKEIAVVYPSNDFNIFAIKSPYPVSHISMFEHKQNSWLAKHHHGLLWEHGTTTLEAARRFLQDTLPNDTTVFVKGLEKIKWTQELLNSSQYFVRNLEDLGCISLNDLRQSFKYGVIPKCRSHFGICALENAFLLKNFVVDIYNKTI